MFSVNRGTTSRPRHHPLLSLLLSLLLLLLLLLCFFWFSWYFQYISQRANCTQQPQISSTCFTAFAVPSNAAFCKSSMLLFTFNFFCQHFNLLDVTPRASITTETTTTCDKFQVFFSCLLGSL